MSLNGNIILCKDIIYYSLLLKLTGHSILCDFFRYVGLYLSSLNEPKSYISIVCEYIEDQFPELRQWLAYACCRQ